MPSNQYRLPGIEEKLVISWDGHWENLSITLGNQLIGRARGGATALRQGRHYDLADGSRLSLKLTEGSGPDALLVRRNGRPLLAVRGLSGQIMNRSVVVLYLVALINVGLGMVTVFSDSRFDALGIAGTGSVISGAVLLALAVLFQRRRSPAPLLTGIVVYILDGLLGYTAVVNQGGEPGLIGYIARAWFLYYLVQAAMLLRDQRRASARSE